jgi:hypothetical protein
MAAARGQEQQKRIVVPNGQSASSAAAASSSSLSIGQRVSLGWQIGRRAGFNYTARRTI